MNAKATTALARQSIDELEKLEEELSASSLDGRDYAAALLIFILACLLAWAVGVLVREGMRRYTSAPEYVDQLASRFSRSVVVFVGFALSLERLRVDVGWFALIVALVGVIIVLMVRPLIENGASALLLTSRPSFSVGDDIETNGHRGEVIAVNARSTVIRTPDRRRIHIPNNDVLDNPIVVYTAYGHRRSEFDVEVAYDADPARVSTLLLEAALSVEGVRHEPPPDVQARGFGNGTLVMKLRWWHDGNLGADASTLDGLVRAVKRVLDGAGIDMPAPELIIHQPDLEAGPR